MAVSPHSLYRSTENNQSNLTKSKMLSWYIQIYRKQAVHYKTLQKVKCCHNTCAAKFSGLVLFFYWKKIPKRQIRVAYHGDCTMFIKNNNAIIKQ